MDSKFERCVREGKIVKTSRDEDLIKKELEAADFDLKRAINSAKEKDFKWATVQAYYSMFHTAKALVLSKGYREKSHFCLSIAIKALFVDGDILEEKHYNNFRDAMDLREDADYGLVYSDSSSEGALGWAKDFLAEAKKIISN